jgi:hypothetical protein
MDPGKPAADYTLEIFADPVTVRDVVRGEAPPAEHPDRN